VKAVILAGGLLVEVVAALRYGLIVLAPVMMDLKNLRLGSVGLDRLSWLALDRLG
jgi:hypothetical protein